MKKFISLIITIIMVFTIPSTAFASEPAELTEEELFRKIANNTATVTCEVRALSSYTQEEIEQSPDLQQIFNKLHSAEPYSINRNSIEGDMYSIEAVTDNGDTVIYRSCPKVTFSVTDVGTASSADIYSTFEIIETVSVNGNLNSGWDNPIRYKNIEGTMGCGVNTAFTNDVTLSGNSAGTLSVNIKGIISFLSSVKDYATVSTILKAFDAITYNGGKVSSRDITSEYVRVVGAKIGNGVLFSDEHNLAIQSSLSTIDSTKAFNQSTKAVAEWTFDVYFYLGSLHPEHSDVSLPIDVNYLVNVK